MELREWGPLGTVALALLGLVWKGARQSKQIEDNEEKIEEVEKRMETTFSEIKTGQTLILEKMSEHHKTIHEKVDELKDEVFEQGKKVAKIEGKMGMNGGRG